MLYCTTEIFKEVLNIEHYPKCKERNNKHFQAITLLLQVPKNPRKEGRSRMIKNVFITMSFENLKTVPMSISIFRNVLYIS
jgi:hypothetical protein